MSQDRYWAQVELYRWQHGDLPPTQGSGKPLDVSVGLEAMADGLTIGPADQMPPRVSVAIVLRYVAQLLREAKGKEKS